MTNKDLLLRLLSDCPTCELSYAIDGKLVYEIEEAEEFFDLRLGKWGISDKYFTVCVEIDKQGVSIHLWLECKDSITDGVSISKPWEEFDFASFLRADLESLIGQTLQARARA